MGLTRVIAKDLQEFSGVRGIALAVVAPAILLLLVGQLQTNAPPLSLLIAGMPACDADPVPTACDAERLLREMSGLRITTRRGAEPDPLARMQRNRFDAVLQFNAETPTDSLVYVASTEPLEVAQLRGVATWLERTAHTVHDSAKRDTNLADLHNVSAVAASEGRGAFLYFPLAADPIVARLPMTIALIVCLLPFTLAAPSLFREREARTLDALLTAPRVGRIGIFAGKMLAPVAVTVVSFLLMVVLTQFAYHLYVKRGLIEVTFMLLPAMTSSALLGMAVSSVVTSQAQVMMATTVYLIGMIVGAGFLFPINQGSALLQWVAMCFPLAFVRPLLNAWMFGAGPYAFIGSAIAWLIAQALATMIVAVAVYRRMLMQI